MIKRITSQLVEFKSTDRVVLPGLLFEPAKEITDGKTKKVAINLHGNGSSSVFYSFARTKALAEALQGKGLAFLTFNNRGAHYLKKLDQETEAGEMIEVMWGTAFELIKDCQQDIDGALQFLENLGYQEFYLIGHSTGANKICVYNYYQPQNKIAKYVLLGGGDDTGLLHDLVGGTAKFKQYLQQAKEKIEQGQGRKLIPKYMLDYTLSYQAFYDTCNPDGDYNVFPFNEYLNELGLSTKTLFREYHSIKKPTLVIYGENDEYCPGGAKQALEILQQKAFKPDLFEFALIEEADHGFHGQEKELAELVAEWLGGKS